MFLIKQMDQKRALSEEVQKLQKQRWAVAAQVKLNVEASQRTKERLAHMSTFCYFLWRQI